MNIRQLDILRGIAAFLVTIFHMEPFIEYISPGNSHLFNGGSYLGVSVFFILSGFVIGVATSRDNNFFVFSIKRIFRVYIPAVIATFIYLVVTKKNINVYDVFLFYPSGGPAPYYGYGTFFITWTLVYELLFYIIFAVSMRFSSENKAFVAIGIIFFNVIVLQFILNGKVTLTPGFDLYNEKCPTLLLFLTNPINLLFVVGLLFYKYFEKLGKTFSAMPKHILKIFFFIGMCISLFGYFNATGHGILQMGIYSSVLFMCFILMHFIQMDKNKICVYEWVLIWLGKVSYSLYLCHYIAIEMRIYYFNWLGIKNVNYHFFVIMIATLILTVIFYIMVDKPVHMAGKALARKLRTLSDHVTTKVVN